MLKIFCKFIPPNKGSFVKKFNNIPSMKRILVPIDFSNYSIEHYRHTTIFCKKIVRPNYYN
jgi:hypothetical protein